MMTSVSAIKLASIKKLVEAELTCVDTLIKERLFFNAPLISTICQYLLDKGGKRLRPLLLLLSARLFYNAGKESICVATVLEFLHAATLLHDDVIDNSELRHHRKTANAIWGNTGSVLVGDYLHVLSFEMLNQLANPKVTQVIVAGTRMTVEGEIMQLMHRNNIHITEEQYTAIIHNKTACFFAIAAQLGAIIAESSQQEIAAMTDYGTHLGIAYQLIDDALDYSASTLEIGKNIGDDLREGRPTLPLIYAMQRSNASDLAFIQHALLHGGNVKLEDTLEILHKTKALEYTVEKAHQHIDKAIAALPSIFRHSEAYAALEQLAMFVIESYLA